MNVEKERRLHNYRQMDFMSRCHGLTIKEIIVLFDSQEIKAWKKKLSAEVKLKKKHKKVDKHKNIGKRKE